LEIREFRFIKIIFIIKFISYDYKYNGIEIFFLLKIWVLFDLGFQNLFLNLFLRGYPLKTPKFLGVLILNLQKNWLYFKRIRLQPFWVFGGFLKNPFGNFGEVFKGSSPFYYF